ncbi:MAG: flagellar biosynthetic protein FliO [Planctomycetes bacterium]|nr:flagellar biosynthetic protein FliO [Planctomycetota bacterium]
MAAVIALTGLSAVAVQTRAEATPGNANARASLTATSPTALDDPWSAVAPESPEHGSRTLQRRSGAQTSPLVAGRPAQAQYSVPRTLGALAGVVGLIVLLAWGYRAMTGGRLTLLNKARRPGLIELVSKTSLSARQSLCLVRIGPRLVLIGQSPEHLRTLDVIDDADLAARLIGEAAQKRAGSSQAEFHECLEREAKGYEIEDVALNETISPEALRVADVHLGLTDAIQRIRRVASQV